MSISPTKISTPATGTRSTATLLPPPSPATHRLRRLNSAQNLSSDNARSNMQPSLISQQRQTARQVSPSRKLASTDPTTAPSQGVRSAGDGAMGPPNTKNTHSRKINLDAPSLDHLIRSGPPNGDLSRALEMARLTILDSGIKADGDGMSSLRIYVWLILLNAPIVSTDSYLDLIHRGASPAYSKIRNDTFRTLATDPLFRRRVSEASLIRLLNAVAWKLHDAKEQRALTAKSSSRNSSVVGSPEHSTPQMKSRARALTLTTEGSDAGTSEPGTYVQGMNVLAAPFLYAARSEAEAFASFYRFITTECPGYVRGAMDGVHKGLALVDKVLAVVDPKLSLYLIGKGMQAELYAFPSVLTLCACTPPLPEVLRLWDFLFAYGAHLNILCIVAQLVMLRQSILNSPSPTKILRSLPPLQAEIIMQVTLTLIKKIPNDVFAEIVTHAK